MGRLVGQCGHVVVIDSLCNQVPPRSHADLPLVQEGSPGTRGCSLRHVDIVENDQRGVPAQLQVRTLEVASGQLTYAPTYSSRSGKRNDSNQRLGNQRLTDFCSAWQDMQQPIGQAGFLKDSGKDHSAAHSGPRVGLEDNRVSQGQCWCDRPHSQDLREVKWSDDAHNASRNPLGKAQPRLLAWQQLTAWPGRQRGRLEDLLNRYVGLELSGRTDLATLPDHPVLDLGSVRFPQASRAPEYR